MERRREFRYRPVGIEARIDGVAAAIVDVSRSAVRVLRSPETTGAAERVEIEFLVRARRRRPPRSWRVAGHIVRCGVLDVTYRYEPPSDQWERVLRAHDSFEQTKLAPF